MNRARVAIAGTWLAFSIAACGADLASTSQTGQGGSGGSSARTGGSSSTGGGHTGGGTAANTGGGNTGGTAAATGGTSAGGTTQATGGNPSGGQGGARTGGTGNGGKATGGTSGGSTGQGGNAGGQQGQGGSTSGGAATVGGAPGGSTGQGGGTSSGGQGQGGGTSSGGQGTGGGSTSGGSPSGGTGTTGGATSGGSTAQGGGNPSGGQGTGGATATGGSTSTGGTQPGSIVVTSAQNDYWKTVTPTDSTGTAEVTVNDSSAAQTWEGFGGCFNEMGWGYLTSAALQTQAINLLFGADGANFVMGRIPIGASDYADSRYTLDDTGTDVTPNSGESNRPAADTSLSSFSITRDQQKLIPYIKAALAVKPNLRLWASPWTPPVWMKTGYKTDSGAPSGGNAVKPSYYDGGTMKSDTTTLNALAQYFVKFVQAYKDEGINIETVAPQNEPNFDQNYPSCKWQATTYTTFVKSLASALSSLGTKIMLGTMSNTSGDPDIVTSVMGDSSAKSSITSIGVQWGMMDRVSSYKSSYGLPIWVSEHKCGNYPWNPSGFPSYVSAKAPNDHTYGVESWGYIRDAIKAGVTAYNAWNMVLDPVGKGIDTSRDWAQNSLLVVNGGQIVQTPAFYVFRHVSQYVAAGAKVVGTSGGDAIAFKNPDNSLVAVMYNSGSAKTTIVSIGGKKLQFSMPGNGWATVKYSP